MNPQMPSREQIEERITALLLGELPAAEAELLRWTISRDASLQRLHDELQATISLVREAVKPAATAAAEKNAPQKFSDSRRQKLLAHFKTPRPKPSIWLRPIIQVPQLVSVFALVAVVALLAVLLLPVLSASKSKGVRGTYGSAQGGFSLSEKVSEFFQRGREAAADKSLALSAVPAPLPPAAVTVAPEPALAPPPVQIVLPPADEQPLPGVSSAAPENAAEERQLIEAQPKREQEKFKTRQFDGFFVPQPESAPAAAAQNAAPPDSRSGGNVQNAGVVNAFAGAGGFGGFGGGIGGTTVPPPAKIISNADVDKLEGEPPPTLNSPNSTVLAWNGSDANSSLAQQQPGAAGHGFALLGPVTGSEALPQPSAGTLSDDLNPGTAVTQNQDRTVNKFYRLPAQPADANKVPLAGDVPVLGSLFQNSTAASTMAQSVTNAPALNAGGFFSGSSPTPTLNEQQRQTINQQADANKNQPYDDAKRELEQKQQMHELLYSKLEAEKLDLGLTKTSMIQITDRAEPAQGQSAWQKLTGEFESKARIKVESDVNDIAGLNTTPTTGSYDPYFVQTTTEAIQSDAVLGKVVDTLKLDDAWSKQNGGEKLTKHEVISQLKKRLDLKPVENTKLIEIAATSSDPTEAAQIANAVAKAYSDYRFESRKQLTDAGLKTLESQYAQQEQEIQLAQAKVDQSAKESKPEQADLAIRKPAPNAPVPQPEILTRENNFSTFSLNVSDVSFKLAAASLEKGQLPDAASIRSEEFINAFDYRDPEAAAGRPLAFAAERARYPFAHNRDLLRFSVKTAAAGRPAGRALNLVLLLDTSGSMERADRVAIIREALRVLAAQLQPQDTVSVVTFARTARLWADGVPGDKAGETLDRVGGITPEGGTNLEEAMRLAYETARRHYLVGGMNRVVLLTDGAANLGNVDPGALKQKVEAQRRQGIALDCFGIGWEDFNDDLLEQLSGNGDGRYAFINSPEDAANDFAAKLAGALQVAAQDVKVQVEFNPQRVISWRQIGYAKHQLTKEQFRDNSVIAAEIAAQEAGNALYTVETKPDGLGPIATVYVRYRIPGTQDVRERSWSVDYTGTASALEQSSPAMRLAATAAAFSEWLAASPFAQEVSPDELLKHLSGVPQIYGADQRPAKLETMIREAKSVAGK
jgi:Mg-chelatase subunit ChlD